MKINQIPIDLVFFGAYTMASGDSSHSHTSEKVTITAWFFRFKCIIRNIHYRHQLNPMISNQTLVIPWYPICFPKSWGNLSSGPTVDSPSPSWSARYPGTSAKKWPVRPLGWRIHNEKQRNLHKSCICKYIYIYNINEHSLDFQVAVWLETGLKRGIPWMDGLRNQPPTGGKNVGIWFVAEPKKQDIL